MKCLLLTTLVLFYSTLVFSSSDLEKVERMVKIFTECQSSTGATAEEVKMMMNKKEPESHNGKCMFSCILNGINIIKDGKINKEQFMPWMSMQKGSDEKKAEVIFNECNSMSDPDPCEHAVKAGFCIRITSSKHGIECDF